jgi:hypothetical protein
VLIAGASGQVGRALQAAIPQGAEVHALTHAQLDISDAAAVRRTLADFSPAVVINAAAYTAVDRAETEPAAVDAITATGPRHRAPGSARCAALDRRRHDQLVRVRLRHRRRCAGGGPAGPRAGGDADHHGRVPDASPTPAE